MAKIFNLLKKGQTVGIKLKDDVKAGAEIYAYE